MLQLDSQPLSRPESTIRIEIDAAEVLALRGAGQDLRKGRPRILAGLNLTQLAGVTAVSPADFLAKMAALGYVCRTLGDRPFETPAPADPGIQSEVFAPG